MNNDEAKFILQARRSNGADDQTPDVRAALDQASRDPALGAWLAAQTRFNAKVAASLRAVQPPANLRDLILAGASVQPTILPWWKRQTPWLAMAASVALIGAVVLWGPIKFRPTTSTPEGMASTDALTALRDLALHESRGMHDDAVHADSLGALGDWLENPVQRLTVGLPVDFAALQALGCRTLTVGGREVLEVCFKRDKVYHLYVARRSDFTLPASPDSPEITSRDGVAAASWADNNMVYILAAAGGGDAFNGVL